MRILIACEYSGRVRDAFIAKGHDAVSCDILPSDSEGPHIQGDVSLILKEKWDMVIAFPPCTYLCVPGAHYLHKQADRWGKMEKARDFFNTFLNLDVEKVIIENPLPHRYAELPKYTQIIHPWMFGQEYTKRTCLWLKNVPELKPTKIVSKGERYTRKDGTTSNSKWYAKSNAKERSIPFQGIANAMADQWG